MFHMLEIVVISRDMTTASSAAQPNRMKPGIKTPERLSDDDQIVLSKDSAFQQMAAVSDNIAGKQ
jgi:hypothetical protein